jgi:hypothetical protein
MKACLNYFYAKDLEQAQLLLRQASKSPMTKELELLSNRLDGYLGDALLNQYEAESEEAPEKEEEPEEIQLADNPLSTKVLPKQKGRRVTKKELEERVAAMEEEENAE